MREPSNIPTLRVVLGKVAEPFNAVPGRVARPASVPRNMAKTLRQMLAMWSVFLFTLPGLVYAVEDRLRLKRYRFASRRWRLAGALLFLLGWALAEVSAVFMVVKGQGTPLPSDAPRELVIAGPYRYIRNPMAMGSLAQGFAVGLFLGSPLVVLYALIGTVGWNYTVRPWEELDLEKRFGEPYAHYRNSVRCWVPRLEAYEPDDGRWTMDDRLTAKRSN